MQKNLFCSILFVIDTTHKWDFPVASWPEIWTQYVIWCGYQFSRKNYIFISDEYFFERSVPGLQT